MSTVDLFEQISARRKERAKTVATQTRRGKSHARVLPAPTRPHNKSPSVSRGFCVHYRLL